MINKRELILKTLDFEETEIIPVHNFGFEKTGTAYQIFAESDEADDKYTMVPHAGDITESVFWNVDVMAGDPFSKTKPVSVTPPKEYPNHSLSLNGSLHTTGRNEKTGLNYGWYVGPYFTKKEILMEYWGKYGKPTDRLRDDGKITRKLWDEYCSGLEKYYYPIASVPFNLHEAMYEGMGFSTVAYYMRKDPEFIHFILNEYTKANLEIIKQFAEAGIEVVWISDDLGQKERSITSTKRFKEFFIPYYKQMYEAAHKHSMKFIQHACGYIENLLPDLIDAGLDAIQALEPAAGVDMARVRENHGDKIVLIGGMDSSVILNFGTPEEVAADVKKCIKDAGKNGGYIAGPSHNIMDVPWENIEALRAALEKYRRN
jgi:uroporphyrinogen decarboxylase-like protein